MPTIAATDLSCVYAQADSKFTAIDAVNFEIKDGEFVCLIGHSGCGKTTLLNMIAGLIPPTAGTLLLDGRPVQGPGSDRAILFQQYSLFPWQTARKNVTFAAMHCATKRTREQARAVADEMLGHVGMAEFADRYPYQLSGGMQQRVALARALAMDPEVLLLDEPFGALDAKRRSSLQRLLVELWEKSAASRRKTVVFVTHDIDEAILMADRIVFMRRGQISAVRSVPFERPRTLEEMRKDPRYDELKGELLELFDMDQEEDDHESDL